MFRQPLRNFLLSFLLNFCLKIFLVASKHFKVDIEPYTDKPSGYKTLSPLKDPLPVVEEKRAKKDFKSILEKLKCASPTNAPVNLAGSHFGPFLIAQAVNLYISLGLSLRQAAFAIKQFWQVRVSYEIIQPWVVSLAAYLAPLVKLLSSCKE